MSDHTHDNMAPPAVIKAAALLALLALALVIAVRSQMLPAASTAAETRAAAHVAPVAERLLRFGDRADGKVDVTNAATGAPVATLGRDDNGFIRGVVRSLARERRQNQIGSDAPFRLAQWPNGALSLTDTATGRTIELNGFGPDNRAAFVRLLGYQEGGVAL